MYEYGEKIRIKNIWGTFIYQTQNCYQLKQSEGSVSHNIQNSEYGRRMTVKSPDATAYFQIFINTMAPKIGTMRTKNPTIPRDPKNRNPKSCSTPRAKLKGENAPNTDWRPNRPIKDTTPIATTDGHTTF